MKTCSNSIFYGKKTDGMHLIDSNCSDGTSDQGQRGDAEMHTGS